MPVTNPSQPRQGPIPLMVLTGFLGAGKTTLLNRVLAFQHHRRVAVLVNELGRIDIDAGLIRARAGDVLELTGGCVCHQIGVQRELWSALRDIVRRSRPEIVVLETTGIAEPDEIWAGLAAMERERAAGDAQALADASEPAGFVTIEASSTLTVVDAGAGERQLERHEEARAQIVAADRILLSKMDTVASETLGGLHRALHALNPLAERASFPPGDWGTAALARWFLDPPPRPARARARTGGARPPDHPEHARPGGTHQLAAATFVDAAPLIGDALLLVCGGLGDRLVRAKGPVHLAGETRQGFLEKAGQSLRLDLREPWGSQPPLTRLVLIGEDLDEAALHRQLWACRAAASADSPP